MAAPESFRYMFDSCGERVGNVESMGLDPLNMLDVGVAGHLGISGTQIPY